MKMIIVWIVGDKSNIIVKSILSLSFYFLKTFLLENLILPLDSYYISTGQHCSGLSHSAMPNNLQPRGLQPTRLLCSWGFPRQEYWSGFPFPSPENLPNSGIEPRQILDCLSDQVSPFKGIDMEFYSTYTLMEWIFCALCNWTQKDQLLVQIGMRVFSVHISLNQTNF